MIDLNWANTSEEIQRRVQGRERQKCEVVFGRQRSRAVRALVLQFGGPEFKSALTAS